MALNVKDVLISKSASSKSIKVLSLDTLKGWLKTQNDFVKRWIQGNDFKAKEGQICCVPNEKGDLDFVLFGKDSKSDFWGVGQLPLRLPQGDYHLDPFDPEMGLAWGLGCYQFDRYKSEKSGDSPRLVLPKGDQNQELFRTIEHIYLIRDLINTPALDMGPEDLADVVCALAKRHSGKCKVVKGRNLLKQNFPTIYHVGKSGATDPCLIDLTWGQKSQPKVTLVGKGVCFDTGGLNLKPGSSMTLMKKDMGGAAQVIGLAGMIMDAKLPIRLRVLISAVENNVSREALRPLDIIPTRKGLTIEIGNTDAEGRVVLADALYEGSQEKPDLLIDCATLTGAARIALGTELPAYFCNHESLAQNFEQHSLQTKDPVWRLPLWSKYEQTVRSKTADLSNIPASSYGGAIAAGLFLQHFVEHQTPWIHMDLMAWNLTSSPGRPQGGEAMGVRALYSMIKAKYT